MLVILEILLLLNRVISQDYRNVPHLDGLFKWHHQELQKVAKTWIKE